MLRNISAYVFFGSLFSFIAVWGYWPKLWAMEWTSMVLVAASVVSLILWGVFSLDSLSLWLKKRSTQFGLGLALTALSALAILVGVNVWASLYNKKWDVTKNQMHTLSDQSRKLVRDLKEKVTLRVWSTNLERMSANLDLKRFLESYKIESKGNVELEIRHPNNDRAEAAKDNVKRDNVIVIRSASGREARVENFNDTKGEEQITNGIIQVVKGGKKTVCFLAGHGEMSISQSGQDGLSTIKSRLEDSSYTAQEIVLATAEAFPPQCEALVVAGPTGDPSKREATMLKTYLSSGGRMIALLGPGTKPAWRKLVADYGIELQRDLVIDPRVQPPFAVATKNYAKDVDITKSFDPMVIFPETSSLKVPTAANFNGATVKTFISSESQTYSKMGELKDLKDLRRVGADKRGPLPLAVLVTKPLANPAAPLKSEPTKGLEPLKKPAPVKKEEKATGFRWPSLIEPAYAQDGEGAPDSADANIEYDDTESFGHGEDAPMAAGTTATAKDGPKDEKKETNLIVVGNSTFVANAIVSQMGNMDMFLNSVNYLLKDQDLMGIRPREIRQASLQLSNENLRQVYATILLIAALFALGGVRAGRRKRA